MEKTFSPPARIVIALVLCLTAFGAYAQTPNSKTHKKASPKNGDNGIFVDTPKVYDDASLAALFAQAQANLAQLNAFDSGTLLKGIGALQGATANQSQIAAQVTSPLITGSPSTTSQTTTNPTIPAQSSPPAFGLPSTFSPSALNLLNEQTQLNFQITNLQLLLQGALSDQIVPGTSIPKPHLTLGFPISINVPRGYEYQRAVAEVQITACRAGTDLDSPSVVALLPQAKTYNVASIVSKSSQISGGAVSNVVNLGGSWLHGKQTYYIVQDQDTLAVQRQSDQVCSLGAGEALHRGASFGWQFKPVLGQKVVQDGLRQTLVQLSFAPQNDEDNSADTESVVEIHIRTFWRRYDPKTGRIGEAITPFTDFVADSRLFFGTNPIPYGVLASDNSDGTLTVEVKGAFKGGTFVQIGNTTIDGSSAATFGFSQKALEMRFVASAFDIATKGAKLVTRDGAECQIVSLVLDPTSKRPVCSPGFAIAGEGVLTAHSESPRSVVELESSLRTNPAKPGVSTTPPSTTEGGKSQRGGAVSSVQSSRQTSNTAAMAEATRASYETISKISAQGSSGVKPKIDVKQFLTLQTAQIDSYINTIQKALSTTPTNAAVWNAAISPYSDTLSLVLLTHVDSSEIPDFGPLGKPVVVIGSKLFGLRDLPYRDVIGNYQSMSLLVPNDLVQSSASISVRTLFTADTTQESAIPLQHAPDILTSAGVSGGPAAKVGDKSSNNPPHSGFVVTNVRYLFTDTKPSGTVISVPGPPVNPARQKGAQPAPAKTGRIVAAPEKIADSPSQKKYYYVVMGSHLENLQILGPGEIGWEFNTGTEPTLKIFSLTDREANLQKIVFRDGKDGPFAVADLPSVPAAGTASNSSNRTIDAQTSTAVGATKLTFQGYGLDQIVSIKYLNTPLQFTPPKAAAPDPKTNPNADKKTLDVTLSAPLVAPGITLTVVFADKTLTQYPVPVPLPSK